MRVAENYVRDLRRGGQESFMEMQDLAAFAGMALLLCCPLVPIYLILKLFNWNQRKKLFSDSWLVYISWLISSLVVIFIFGVVLNRIIITGSFPVAMIALLIINTLAIALTLSLSSREKKTPHIFGNETEETSAGEKQKVWRTSICVNVVTILIMFALFFVATGIETLIEKLNPKPKTSFEIYDI